MGQPRRRAHREGGFSLTFVRLVRFRLADGREKVAEDLAGNLVPAIRALDGCRSVALYGDVRDGEHGLIVLWESAEAADAAAAAIRPRLMEALQGNVEGPPDIRLFKVLAE